MFISMFHSITLQASACKTGHSYVKACRWLFLTATPHITRHRRGGQGLSYLIIYAHTYIYSMPKSTPQGAPASLSGISTP